MARTQKDLVEQSMGPQLKETVEKLVIPGIDQLHNKSTDDIAQALTMVLKSRPNITRLNYVIGEYIELTTEISG